MDVNWAASLALRRSDPESADSSAYESVKLDDNEGMGRGATSLNDRNRDDSVEGLESGRNFVEDMEEEDSVQHWGQEDRDVADASTRPKSMSDDEEDPRAFSLPPAPSAKNQLKAMLRRQWLFKVRFFLRIEKSFLGGFVF
jgi:hypothetical protein